MSKKFRSELLAPAGDLEKAMVALDYGADAVFVGAKSYSLRARASNFELEQIKTLIDYGHSLNKKVYLVTNVICHTPLLRAWLNFIQQVVALKPDGFICADPYIITYIKNHYPDAEIHISTQQSICNSKAAKFFKRNGASRVVLSRELTLEELELFVKNNNKLIEIEIFIHGAVCISYSGRCMMSNNFSLRDANVGGCAHACRWKYDILDDKFTNAPSKFTMSAKDMIQITNITKLMDLEIDSFKIEGRMKSVHYIATVVNAYKKAMDAYYRNEVFDLEALKKELQQAMNRMADVAWLDGAPNEQLMLYHDKQELVSQRFAFIIEEVLENNVYKITSKNNFKKDELFEVIGPKHEHFYSSIKSIYDLTKQVYIDQVITPNRLYLIEFNDSSVPLQIKDMARIVEQDECS